MIEADQILAGLGGAANIVDVQACVTRVRCEVRDPAEVDEAALTAAGAVSVITTDNAVHVVVGAQSAALVDDIEDLM
ncbi:PTS transporter subunit EIIB [Rudaeicoccus suwonensis]|uniref:PTS system N-acetylglucosamine-specific IIB component (Glc family) n=1 Tax=Rudaeicoccus suwonensis TaxID=657409 RepID=A0A561E3C4_9MICO|nr:PTS transporter subunit EIIB [Rudaeicoccus suwonensis]TWE10116.1 PTS system N-acetylglucosamine-specific IIB component (Glc family) [Rudaeicoccus suwonensis]